RRHQASDDPAESLTGSPGLTMAGEGNQGSNHQPLPTLAAPLVRWARVDLSRFSSRSPIWVEDIVLPQRDIALDIALKTLHFSSVADHVLHVPTLPQPASVSRPVILRDTFAVCPQRSLFERV